MTFSTRSGVLALAALLLPAPAFAQWHWMYKGTLAHEVRLFDEPESSGQVRSNLGFLADVEGGCTVGERWRMSGRVYARNDFKDSHRGAVRADELWVQYAAPRFDVRVGNQVFTWGAMEVFGIADILNSRDFVDHIVTPRKIGQPAVRARFVAGNGNVTAYYLPYFVPAVYPGQESPYSVGGTIFERHDATARYSGQYALRYFYGGNGFDIGVSAFSGLERDAIFEADFSRNEISNWNYRSNRVSVDATKVVGGLLVKGEAVYRKPDTSRVDAALLWALGSEYTWASIAGKSDLTAFFEIAGDRQKNKPSDFQFTQNNLFVGATWELQDRLRQSIDAGWVKNYAKGSGYWAFLGEYTVRPWPHLRIDLEYQQLSHFSLRDPVSNNRNMRLMVGYEF
jgi:hypothetical protein